MSLAITSARNRVVILSSVALVLGLATMAFLWLTDPEHSPEVLSTHRVNGDVMVLAYSVPFPDEARVLALARANDHVTRAGPFAIWPVTVTTSMTQRPGLLKLQPLDADLVKQLRLEAHRVPQSNSDSQQVEVAVGTLLAAELRARLGDEVTIRVEPGAGTEGAATVKVKIVSLVDWGLPYHNRQLLYADLSHRATFRLHLTGVELVLDSARAREPVAADLQRLLGKGFRTLTLNELMASRPSSSAK
jgi:ABC-type lipoprotein release transport system permease subunit